MKELIENYHKMKRDMILRIEHDFKESFKKFFEDNPQVHGFKWTQYTDYFNDGEACIFHRHEIVVMHNENEEGNDYYDLLDNKVEATENATAFIDELEDVPHEIYESMFGDHVSVMATRKGFEISEYENHD